MSVVSQSATKRALSLRAVVSSGWIERWRPSLTNPANSKFAKKSEIPSALKVLGMTVPALNRKEVAQILEVHETVKIGVISIHHGDVLVH